MKWFKFSIIIIFLFCISSKIYSKNQYYVVTTNNLNVRVLPEQNSEVTTQLKITSIVKFIKGTGKKVKIGKLEGEWVFVETDKNPIGKPREKYKGWVFDYYLVKDADFKYLKK